MPMPRANVQSLDAHVSNMAGSARGYVFGNNNQNSKQAVVKPEPMTDDDDDFFSSSSDSDSDMSDGEGTENFLSKINAATASKKTHAEPKDGAKISGTTSTQTTATNRASMFRCEPSEDVKIKPEATTDNGDSSSSSGNISESNSEEEKPVAASKRDSSKTESKKTAAASSSDSSGESDDEDEDEANEESGANIAAKKKTKQSNTDSHDKDDSSSSEGSEGKSEEEARAFKQLKAPATDKSKKAVQSSSSGSDSESESEYDETSSEETSSSDDEQAVPAKSITTKKSVDGTLVTKSKKQADNSDTEMADKSFALVSNIQTSNGEMTEEFIREGFHLRKASEYPAVSEVLEILKKAKHEGKQIWYFTTPASIPISVVEKMNFPMRNAQTGEAIVSHDGVDYGVDLGASGVPSIYKILVPARKGDKYEMDRGIDHTMHLKRITQFSASDLTAKPKTQIRANPPRPQPAVLKKRYTPIGVPTPILPPLPAILKKNSDVAMPDASNVADGNGPTSAKKSKKRKAGAEEVAKTLPSENKSKKAKTINSVLTDTYITQSTPSSSTPSGTKKKSQVKDRTTTTTPSSQAKSGTKSSAEVVKTQTPVPLPKIPGLKR